MFASRPPAASINPTKIAPSIASFRDSTWLSVLASSRLTSKLIRAGFLLPRRDVGREEAYWFSMPQVSACYAVVLPEIALGGI